MATRGPAGCFAVVSDTSQAMSQENVEIVRAALDAFNAGDVEGSVANLAPEFEYVPTGSIPGSEETYRGTRGVEAVPRVVLGRVRRSPY